MLNGIAQSSNLSTGDYIFRWSVFIFRELCPLGHLSGNSILNGNELPDCSTEGIFFFKKLDLFDNQINKSTHCPKTHTQITKLDKFKMFISIVNAEKKKADLNVLGKMSLVLQLHTATDMLSLF